MRAPARALLLALAIGVTAPAPAQHGAQPMHHRFDDAQKWSRVFDDPERDAWQKPEAVLRALGLAPDALVADLGSGTGYFAVRLARAVPAGRVFAADVSPGMVKFLGERAEREKLANVVPVQAAADDPNLPVPVDLVLVVDTYHHIGGRPAYFERLKTRLRPGGRVAIVDFRLDAPNGPPRRHRVAPSVARAEMERAGYALSAEHDFLPSQYFLVFTPR